jgi:hypothetical protein
LLEVVASAERIGANYLFTEEKAIHCGAKGINLG